MSEKGQRFSVVLMVDMQPDPGNNVMQMNYENRLKCVRSCSLKLLTYFANKVNEDNFKWGFKFYNSVSSNIGDHWGFENFTLGNFELFENRLEEKFESECMKRESLHRCDAKLMTSEYDNTPTSSRLSTAPPKSGGRPVEDDDRSSQLKTGIKEICQDFPWEIYNPNSPTKTTRAKDKRRSGKTDTANTNFVFVFSPCPHSMEGLKKFAECDGINLKAVLYSFMPNYLLKELNKRKIRLSWIDVSPVKHNIFKQPSNLEGLQTMSEALKQIRGCVISASALVLTGSLFTSLLAPLVQQYQTHLSNICENSENPDNGLDVLSNLALPTSAVMDDVCCSQSDVSEQDAYLDLPLGKLKQGEKMLEKLEIHSLHAKHSSQEEEANNPVLQLKLPSDVPGPSGDHSDGETVCLHTGERASQKFALRLQGQGCISAKQLPLQALHNSAVYLVTSKGASPQKFLEPLISVLAQNQQVLVVECMDSVNQTPLIGILQPLTAVSATLTLVKTPFLSILDKLVAFGQPTSTQAHPAHIRHFVDRCAASILGPFKARQQQFSTEHHANEIPCCPIRMKDDSLDTFNQSMVENWYPVSSCKNDKFLEELNNRYTGSRETENKDLLKCLRQFYKANKNKTLGEKSSDPFTSNNGLRRSPRKSPRKAYGPGKSPAKAAKNVLRKSPRKSSLARKGSDKVVVMDRNRSFTAPASSRCTAIFQRSKSTLYESPKKSGKSVPTNEKISKRASAVDVTVTDFKDTPDMVQHLLSLYQQTLDRRNNPQHCAQAMVNIAHHYMQSLAGNEDHNPLEEVDKVFSDFVLQSNNQLRDKYMDPQLASCDDLKAAEFELQILLPLELESLVRTENEELLESKIQQVVTKLRTLAFIRDTNHLNEFLSHSLLDNYVHTLPKVLVMIYEELLQPLPPQLEAYGEDDDMASSVQPPSNASSRYTDPRSALSNDDLSSVRSVRSRKSIGSLPSFTQGTRRQIAITGKGQGSSKMLTRSAKKKSTKKRKKETKAEMRKVRRNLFDPVEAGQKEPPKTPQRASQRIAKKNSLAATPKEYHILKTRKVEETPKHKQVRQALWRRQRTHTDSEVMVVQESPDKCLRTEKTEGPIRTPGRLIGGAKRKSFYSDAPDKQSRSMIRFKESRSVEASQSVQNRYNLLEARMSGRSPNKLNSSQSASSPRRIKPMCLFSHLLSPSPSKPMQLKGTPGSARRRLNISDFDTPSKNTRSQNIDAYNQDQAVESEQIPFDSVAVKSLTFTPKKTAQFESLFAGRSRGMGSSPSASRTPVKTPRRIRMTSVSSSQPCNSVSGTPVKGILKTPKKQGPATPLKDNLRALSMGELLMSPSRLTRQQAKTFMLPANSPRFNLENSQNSTLLSNCSVKWEDESQITDKTTDMDESVFISPKSTPSPKNRPTTPIESGSQSLTVPHTPVRGPADRTGKENCFTPKDSRKRIKTPDSLDKWPRRKRRNTMNSPAKNIASTISSEQTDSFGSTRKLMDEEIYDKSSEVLSTPSKSLKTVSSNSNNLSSGLAASNTPKKRKRDLEIGGDDSLTASLLSGSPFKRSKLSALESRMSSSQASSTDYFDSTDVFLNDCETSQKVSNRTVTRIISGGLDGASVFASERPSSPVFPMATHLLTRQGSTQDHDTWSDQDSHGSLSPVFQRKISSLIDNLESDTESSPQKRNIPKSPIVGSPKIKYRKFSPNVSAKSLSHLMMSPLIADKKTNHSATSPEKTETQNKPQSSIAKNSRRSLYKSRP